MENIYYYYYNILWVSLFNPREYEEKTCKKYKDQFIELIPMDREHKKYTKEIYTTDDGFFVIDLNED